MGSGLGTETGRPGLRKACGCQRGIWLVAYSGHQHHHLNSPIFSPTLTFLVPYLPHHDGSTGTRRQDQAWPNLLCSVNICTELSLPSTLLWALDPLTLQPPRSQSRTHRGCWVWSPERSRPSLWSPTVSPQSAVSAVSLEQWSLKRRLAGEGEARLRDRWLRAHRRLQGRSGLRWTAPRGMMPLRPSSLRQVTAGQRRPGVCARWGGPRQRRGLTCGAPRQEQQQQQQQQKKDTGTGAGTRGPGPMGTLRTLPTGPSPAPGLHCAARFLHNGAPHRALRCPACVAPPGRHSLKRSCRMARKQSVTPGWCLASNLWALFSG